MKIALIPALSAALLLSAANVGFAQQTPTPAAPAAAKPAAPAPAAASDDAKKAKSKECSAEADAKSLHGKARKEFRSKCKHG